MVNISGVKTFNASDNMKKGSFLKLLQKRAIDVTGNKIRKNTKTKIDSFISIPFLIMFKSGIIAYKER